MLFNLLALTITSIVMEIIIMKHLSNAKPLKWLARLVRKYSILSFLFSLILSALLAKLVHAEGMTVLIATVTSTVFCSAIVSPSWNLKDKWFPKKEVTA